MDFAKVNESYSALSVRERAMVFAAVLVGLLLLGLQLFVTPLFDEDKKVKQQLLDQKLILGDLAAQYQNLSTVLADDPNDKLREKQRELEQGLSDLENKLKQKIATLLSPKQTQELLRHILTDYKGLTLVEAKNLPAKEIQIQAKESDAAADDTQVKLYEHGFEMRLKGSYFETIKYLSRLEGLSGFYWRSLSYEVTEYPSAEIVLGISTLSIDEAWIGG